METSTNLLSAFVRYILDHHSEEFIDLQMKFSRELKLPGPVTPGSGKEKTYSGYLRATSYEFLQSLLTNHNNSYSESGGQDPMPYPQHPEDLLVAGLIRKKSLSVLLQGYSTDANLLQAIHEELDEAFLLLNLASWRLYEQALRNKLQEESLSREKQKLIQTEELYKQAQSLNKLGNWTWEIKEDHLYWSDELFRIYGLEPQSEKLSFERFVSFIHPDDKEKRLQQLQLQLSHPGFSDYYFRIITADGKQKILYGQSEVLSDEMHIPYRVIGTCQDVTKQKELENNLYQKTIQLEKSNESLEQFAYICSHDLKEPLRKISILGDRLHMLIKDKLDEQSSQLLNKMTNASMRLHRMIDDVLSVSRISSDTNFEKHSLTRILEEVLQSIDLESWHVKVGYENLPELTINESQFRLLFQNLVTNSIKFRKQGLDPHIQVRHQQAADEQISRMGLDVSVKYICICFKDNGIGFDPLYNDKIFGMFQRLHDQSLYEGTGIGLTICKRIVENHNGAIYAEGKPGEGSSFYILIPER